MIRGPVLPQSREALWALVVGRLDVVERGLTLVGEGFDCSDGQLGPVDALARDAAGTPVLLVLAVEGDALLLARTIAAADFLHRAGDSLAAAVPEAAFCIGAPGRVVVIGIERGAAACETLARMVIAGVQVCRLEPFRIAGAERFAVRWLGEAAGSGAAPDAPAPASGSAPAPTSAHASAPAAPTFAIPAHLQPLWTSLSELCQRIDAGMRIDGHRYRRRITWNGHLLADVQLADGALRGSLIDGAPCALSGPADVRTFFDRILRAYARAAGLSVRGVEAADASPGADRDPTARVVGRSGVSLRSAVSSARLTPEEYSALGGPTSSADCGADGTTTADDVARIVAVQESSWRLPGRPE
jgi:hypothetical protein